jgi:hypothetical protein
LADAVIYLGSLGLVLDQKMRKDPNEIHYIKVKSSEDPVIEGRGKATPFAFEFGWRVVGRDHLGQHLDQFISIAITVFDFEIESGRFFLEISD